MYMLDQINSYISDLEHQESGLKVVLAQIKQRTLAGVSKHRHDTATRRELMRENLPRKNLVLVEKEEGIDGSLLEAERPRLGF